MSVFMSCWLSEIYTMAYMFSMLANISQISLWRWALHDVIVALLHHPWQMLTK